VNDSVLPLSVPHRVGTRSMRMPTTCYALDVQTRIGVRDVQPVVLLSPLEVQGDVEGREDRVVRPPHSHRPENRRRIA